MTSDVGNASASQPRITLPGMSVAAAPTRTELRRSRVSQGLQELDRWLADQIRTGLSALPRSGYAHFDAIAARMIDAQAPGVAGVLRSIPAELVADDWPSRVLHELAGLHLLSRAHARLDSLPEDLATTVRSRIGYPTAKADVLARPGVFDSWWPVGSVDVVDATLRRRRVWLRGAETGRWAVWLTFAPPGLGFDESVRPGEVITGEAHFYPGSGQHRALIGQTVNQPAAALTVQGQALAATREDFAALLAEDPWASRLPVALHGVPVRQGSGVWSWQDLDGRTCPLVELEGQPWPLLAQSGGEAVTVFGEWSGYAFRPLAVLPDDRDRVFSTEICG
jgi:hypothetical protein